MFILNIEKDYKTNKNGKSIFYNFINTLSLLKLFILFILSVFLLVSCQGKSQPESNEPESKADAVDVCELISKQDVENAFNVIIENVKNTMQSAAENVQSFASQCSYYVKSDRYKSVGILLKYSASSTSPKTFDELVELNTPAVDPENEAQKKILDEVKNSFINGTKVPTWEVLVFGTTGQKFPRLCFILMNIIT